jgi:predicted Zn finger-like uncharacterized protein
VVVICPKCKAKLKVNEAKLSPTGSRFKCPKCSAVILVKKPAERHKKTLDASKVLVAHSNQEVLESASAVLKDQGYRVITSADGIDVMVKAMREFPFLVLAEVSLPKIYGFELCRKLKAREETKNMKFVLIPSIFDRSKYRREPASLYGADDYIEPQDIPGTLINVINKLEVMPEEQSKKAPQVKKPDAEQLHESGSDSLSQTPENRKSSAQEVSSANGTNAEAIEKAKRLSRNVINDIFLYNTAKVLDSIKNGSFFTIFASELREGKKLYETRIPSEIRNCGNYYKETIEEFVSKKKKELN